MATVLFLLKFFQNGRCWILVLGVGRSFSFFRLAAILEGVVRRAADGNASNPETARSYAAAITLLAAEANAIIAGKT